MTVDTIPAPSTSEWTRITEADCIYGREIIGMDRRGRIRACQYQRRSSRTFGWFDIYSCEAFDPLYMIACPDRRPALDVLMSEFGPRFRP